MLHGTIHPLPLLLLSSSPLLPPHNTNTSLPGYTQSGPLYHAKTRAHEKLLLKAFPASKVSPLFSLYPGGVQLIYPTAPLKLSPADIPGFVPKEDAPEDDEPEAYGWWKRETGGEKYVGLDKGLQTIADAIVQEGGVDGVIGFSQGGCAAGFVASLLEDGRETSFPDSSYPESFRNPKATINQAPLKFAVSYSGFAAPNSLYKHYYEPKIATPFLHVIGSLDSVVEESRSLALLDACQEGTGKRVLYHPGGHFVPIGKEMSGALVGFIRECCEEKKVEEGVEDMDVPF